MSYKGVYRPKNPQKYAGDPTNVIYRSLWERDVMKYLDMNEKVVEWGSEEVIVPYISPVDQKWHRYFVDFIAKIKTEDDSIKTYLIEVKPSKQCQPPVKPKRRTKRFINESIRYGINEAKWLAAKKFAEKRGWQFIILTEKHLR